MSTHNICFHGEIRKILTLYPHLSEAMDMAYLELGILNLVLHHKVSQKKNRIIFSLTIVVST